MGYTLAEAAIGLTVITILLGAAVIPLHERYKISQRLESEALLEEASRAVVGYAVANRTLETPVRDDRGPGSIPAGRPYLPCPDVSVPLDGVEDRLPIQVTVVTLDMAAPATPLERQGVCEQHKGALPWRTLGLREGRDVWGRALGYRVDPAFSSQLLGFDETFRADIQDPRKAMTISVGLRLYQHRDSRNDSGALVCRGVNLSLGCPAAADVNADMLAGVVVSISLTVGARAVPAYDSIGRADAPQGIWDGAAFVVFSHGPNGFGGISPDKTPGQCLQMPPESVLPAGRLMEYANAFYDPAHPFVADARSGCTNMGGFRFAMLAENIFASAPAGDSAGDYVFDDLIMWTSPDLLAGMLLEAGAMPIPKADFLPPEGR